MDMLFYSIAYLTLFFSFLLLWSFFSSTRMQKSSKLRPLSIIVPAYNAAKTIRSCIISLLAQDYPGLKIIVVDDGSTDSTGSIVRKLCRKHKNIAYLRKQNGGKGSALNEGLKRVNTELFGFIDADTHLSRNALRNMIGYIEGNTAAVTAAIKSDNPRNFIERIQNIEYMMSAFARKVLTFFDSLYITPGFSIYKTSVIKRLGGFDELNITEDLEIGLRLKSKGFNIQTSLDDSAYTKVPENFRKLFNQRLRWNRGYIHNTRKYSGLLLNRRYGDFGVLIFPINNLVLALTTPFLLVNIYDMLISVSQRIIDLFLVKFDINYLLSTSTFSIITPTTFFLVATLLAFLFLIRVSRQQTSERINKIDYLIFLIAYPFISLFLWVSAFVFEIVKAKRKW